MLILLCISRPSFSAIPCLIRRRPVWPYAALFLEETRGNIDDRDSSTPLKGSIFSSFQLA